MAHFVGQFGKGERLATHLSDMVPFRSVRWSQAFDDSLVNKTLSILSVFTRCCFIVVDASATRNVLSTRRLFEVNACSLEYYILLKAPCTMSNSKYGFNVSRWSTYFCVSTISFKLGLSFRTARPNVMNVYYPHGRDIWWLQFKLSWHLDVSIMTTTTRH
jgi:hypothetical protein